MYFLNPTYLWAFLGLAVPIAIHLWSKREGKTIKIGSVQLLKKADTKQSSSIKLNELWLLLLRLALVSVLVLILSNLHIRKKIENDTLTYIVEPSLLQNKEIKSILDTVRTNGPVRLLKKGFPEMDSDATNELAFNTPNYWQLAKEMEAIASDSIIVFTNAYQAGFKGIRPEVSKHIDWIPISIDKTQKQLLAANQLDEQLELLVMNSSEQQVSFDKKLLQLTSDEVKLNTTQDSIFYLEHWTAIHTKKKQQVLLFYDTDLSTESYYLEAGFNVLAKYLNREIKVVKTTQKDNIDDLEFDIVIWLSKKPIIKSAGKVVLFKPTEFAHHLIQESLVKNTYHLTKHLDAENVEQGYLPEQLIQLLDINPEIKKKINQYDMRVLAKEAMIPRYSNHTLDQPRNNSLNISQWLWGLFILLLVCERIVSKFRYQ
jgi:hypothetical protein